MRSSTGSTPAPTGIVSSLLRAKNIDVQSYNAVDGAVVDTAQNIIETLAAIRSITMRC